MEKNKQQTTSDIQIIVLMITGKKITLDVKTNDTIESIKQKLQDIIIMPVNVQGLIFCAKMMKNNKLLSDYNVMDGSTLHLVWINNNRHNQKYGS
jgi:hypothetical protein